MRLVHSLRMVFAVFPLSALCRLQRALQDGRVIRGRYRGDLVGYGCLFWQLDSTITTRSQRRNYFVDGRLIAASELIVRSWDKGLLSDQLVLRQLQKSIAKQQAAKGSKGSLHFFGRFMQLVLGRKQVAPGKVNKPPQPVASGSFDQSSVA